MIELVECEKYHARLTIQACAARWRRASQVNETWGNSGGHADPGCRSCEIGRQRAAITDVISGDQPKRGRRAIKKEAVPMTEIKLRCSKCKAEKDLDQFNNNKAQAHRHGTDNWCKTCRNAYDQARERYANKKAEPKPPAKAAPVRGEARPMNPHDFMERGEFRKMMDAPPVMPAPVLSAPMQNCIILDFAEYPELEEFVRDTARDEFRKPEDQVLYIIKRFQHQEAAA